MLIEISLFGSNTKCKQSKFNQIKVTTIREEDRELFVKKSKFHNKPLKSYRTLHHSTLPNIQTPRKNQEQNSLCYLKILNKTSVYKNTSINLKIEKNFKVLQF